MPHIEVVPNSTSISAPGWAYVPDNGYDPSKIAIQPSGARKRAARSSGVAGGDTTTRQQNAVLKHLADLDKDNSRDVQISVPSKQKDGAGRALKSKSTPNVRRILTSQKTFANHLADEEADLALQSQNNLPSPTPRLAISKNPKSSSLRKRSSTSIQPTGNTQTDDVKTSAGKVTGYPIVRDLDDDEPLLRSYIPEAPTQVVMEALLTGPPLSYNEARTAPSERKPQRKFCEICGYWGTIKCMKCGARVCGLECQKTHSDGRCIFYS